MRCPRAKARHLGSRAVSDIMPAGTMTGMRGARCNRGRRRRGHPPLIGAALREAWSEAESLGCVSPLDKSRGGTPEGVRAPLGARCAQAQRLVNLRLSAFCFLFFFGSFVARVSKAIPGGGIEAAPSSPDVASLIRATLPCRARP